MNHFEFSGFHVYSRINIKDVKLGSIHGREYVVLSFRSLSSLTWSLSNLTWYKIFLISIFALLPRRLYRESGASYSSSLAPFQTPYPIGSGCKDLYNEYSGLLRWSPFLIVSSVMLHTVGNSPALTIPRQVVLSHQLSLGWVPPYCLRLCEPHTRNGPERFISYTE